jgi:hypothetical protein
MSAFLRVNPQLRDRSHAAKNAAGTGGADMLHSQSDSSVTWNTLKFAATATAMAILAGCVVAVPLRPLTTASQHSHDRDVACTVNSNCPNAIKSHRRISRHLQPSGDGNIADDPPDFILNSEEGVLR